MTAGQVLLAVVCALGGSVAGGALGGLAVGRKALGSGLAAIMGACFGPLGGFVGALVALGALALWAATRS